MDNDSTRASLFDSVKQLGRLYLDGVRLGTAEKVTQLLAAVAWLFIRIIFAMVVLVFVGIFMLDMLGHVMHPWWAALIVLGFYTLVITLVYLFRRHIIIDPIARLVSRLIVSPPDDSAQ